MKWQEGQAEIAKVDGQSSRSTFADIKYIFSLFFFCLPQPVFRYLPWIVYKKFSSLSLPSWKLETA